MTSQDRVIMKFEFPKSAYSVAKGMIQNVLVFGVKKKINIIIEDGELSVEASFSKGKSAVGFVCFDDGRVAMYRKVGKKIDDNWLDLDHTIGDIEKILGEVFSDK